MKTYLFSLLSDLEIGLGNLVRQTCTESESLQMTFDANHDTKFEETRDRYKADKDNGVDVPFVEYLYLSDLINMIAKKQLFKDLGYESRKQFDKAFGPLNELRKNVCHPVRSLIAGENCDKLWGHINQLEEILFVLRQRGASDQCCNELNIAMRN